MEERVTNLERQEQTENKITLVKESTNYIENYQELMNSLDQLATINTIDNLTYENTVASLNQIAYNAATKINSLTEETKKYQANIVAFQTQTPLDPNNIIDQVQVLNRKNQVENAKKTITKKQKIVNKIKESNQANRSPKQTLLELLGLHSKADITKTITTYQQLNELEQLFNIHLTNYPQADIQKCLDAQQKELEKACKMEKNIQQKRNLLEPILETLKQLNPKRKQVLELKAELVTLINNLSRVDTLQNTISMELNTVQKTLETLQEEKPKLFTKTKKGKQIVHKLNEQEKKKREYLAKQEKLTEEKQQIEREIHTKRNILSSYQQELDNVSLTYTQLHFDKMVEMKNLLELQIQKNEKQISKNPYWRRNDRAELNTLFHMTLPATIPTTEERNNAIHVYNTNARQIQPTVNFVKQLKKI